MDIPHELQTAADQQDDIILTRRTHDDETVTTIDFGPKVEVTLDIVGSTVIVVAGDRQFEFDRPPEASEITTNDGMLMIKE
ncbi:hypothetical protein DMJ13_20255 [halophilic archaeon]|nr:hypothetical protein DMJ13_20255 [halophilic archaeon]